jgi:catechol 2,3-dioxygenase-like lactoylglutathione lyase family enzyme
MKFERLDHVSVSVADIERSVRFYRDQLGLPLLGRGEERGSSATEVVGAAEPAHFLYADFDLGGGQLLEVLQYVRPRGEAIHPDPWDPGSGHLGLLVNDLDATLKQLARRGILPTTKPASLVDPPWWKGARVVYLSDPDGFTVELVERPRQ